MQSPSALCVCVSPLLTFEMSEQIIMELAMYIMAPEPIWTAHFINASHQFCVSVCMLLGNSTVKSYRGYEYISNNRRIAGCVVFYAV
jgi:hypothetical protein